MFEVILFVGVLIQTGVGTPLFDFEKGNGRIIGGERAKLGEFPYIVSLKHGTNSMHTCGASILDETHVLTAAHCVYERTEDPFQVHYGVIDSSLPDNRIDVTKIRMHEDFNPRISLGDDIAILTLAENMVFGPNAQPAVLPKEPLVILEESINSRLSGWGYTEDEGAQRYLLTTTFPLFNDDICHSLLKDFNPTYHICAGSLDGTHKQCTGDSGGPLYARGAQQGIVSWSLKPCNSTNEPGAFTRVANYVDWIENAMDEDEDEDM